MRLHETAAYREVFPKANDFANVLLNKFTKEEAAELRHIEKHLSRLEALISFAKGSVCALRSMERGHGIDFDLPFMPDKHITAALNLGANFIVHRKTPCPTLMRENLETIGTALVEGFAAAKRELADAQKQASETLAYKSLEDVIGVNMGYKQEVSRRYAQKAETSAPKTLGEVINAIVADAEKTMKKLVPDTLKSSPKRLSQAAANFANAHETSPEIAQAIFDLYPGNEHSVWEDPTDEQRIRVVLCAFSNTGEDELFWGQETVSRPVIF